MVQIGWERVTFHLAHIEAYITRGTAVGGMVGDGGDGTTAAYQSGRIQRLGIRVSRLGVSGKGVGGDCAARYFGGVTTHAGCYKGDGVPGSTVAIPTDTVHL